MWKSSENLCCWKSHCIHGSCRASLWQPFQACIPLAASSSKCKQALILWSPAEQQVPGPGATIPVDGIKDSSFLCRIQLQGLFSHSSTPHSPISQQLWSRCSCKKGKLLKKDNLCTASLLLHGYVTCPMSHTSVVPSFPPSCRDWVLFAHPWPFSHNLT